MTNRDLTYQLTNFFEFHDVSGEGCVVCIISRVKPEILNSIKSSLETVLPRITVTNNFKVNQRNKHIIYVGYDKDLQLLYHKVMTFTINETISSKLLAQSLIYDDNRYIHELINRIYLYICIYERIRLDNSTSPIKQVALLAAQQYINSINNLHICECMQSSCS
jgi:hypothetical protein